MDAAGPAVTAESATFAVLLGERKIKLGNVCKSRQKRDPRSPPRARLKPRRRRCQWRIKLVA